MQQGQPDAVRRVFLRAVRQCPGCKALWLEGLLYAAAAAPAAAVEAPKGTAAKAETSTAGPAAAGRLGSLSHVEVFVEMPVTAGVSVMVKVLVKKGCVFELPTYSASAIEYNT